MPDILDDLEVVLGADAVAKLRGNQSIAERLTKGDDLRSWYAGESDAPPAAGHNPPPPASTTSTPPATPTTPGPQEDLRQIIARLDSFGNIDERVASEVNKVVETRGRELTGNAIAASMRNIRELTKLDRRHNQDFGTDLDDNALNAHIQKAQEEGRPFRTMTDAYEDMTRQQRIDKEVERKVRDAVKTQTSMNVPGAAGPSASPMFKTLRAGGPAGSGGTHLDKAATALSERLAERGERVE